MTPPQRALHRQLEPRQRHGYRGDQRARERRRQPPLQPPLSPPHWGARRPHASRHLSRQRDHRPVRRRPRATLLVQERAPPLAPSTLRQPALMGSMLRRASPFSHSLWRREIRATLLLAYPLILTNLAQAAIHATDIILLGWVGPRTLAAGALGVNLFNACLIFGLGLVTASAPMMARELGRLRHSVRDVRRTVRQAMWAAVAIVIPFWLILWQAEPILIRSEEHTSELQSLMRISYAVFCLKTKKIIH